MGACQASTIEEAPFDFNRDEPHQRSILQEPPRKFNKYSPVQKTEEKPQRLADVIVADAMNGFRLPPVSPRLFLAEHGLSCYEDKLEELGLFRMEFILLMGSDEMEECEMTEQNKGILKSALENRKAAERAGRKAAGEQARVEAEAMVAELIEHRRAHPPNEGETTFNDIHG